MKEKIIKYYMVIADDEDCLNNKINEKLKEGFEIRGDYKIIKNLNSDWIFFQPMYKIEYVEDKENRI